METGISKSKKFRMWFDSNWQQYKRVWRLLKRPTMAEFKMISKVTAIGLLIIGAFGFLISIAIKLGLSSFF